MIRRMLEEHRLSERRACRLVGLSRDSYRHPPEADAATRELAGRIGQHPSNGWAGSGEPSFLVFDLTLEAAKALCAKLEQNGFVWSGADAVPRLILLK